MYARVILPYLLVIFFQVPSPYGVASRRVHLLTSPFPILSILLLLRENIDYAQQGIYGFCKVARKGAGPGYRPKSVGSLPIKYQQDESASGLLWRQQNYALK